MVNLSPGIQVGSEGIQKILFNESDGSPKEKVISGIAKDICDKCHQPSSMICSGCKRVRYCSQKCQTAAWKTHQFFCINVHFIPKEEEIVCKFYDSSGIFDISQQEFCAKTGLTFVKAPLFSKRDLKPIQPKMSVAVARAAAPDSVALFYQGETLGYGIITLKDISKGEIVCSFGGKAIEQHLWNNSNHSSKTELYAVSGNNFFFDPSQYASLGALVNDGPPNCELKTYTNPSLLSQNKSLPFEKVIIAIRDIHAGEIIYHDYVSDHPIKQGFYAVDEKTLANLIEKYSKGLDISFLNSTGWVMTAVDLQREDTSDLVKASEIEYIVTTPQILFLLHTKGNLSPSKTLESLEKLSLIIQLQFQRKLSEATVILKCLSKIPIGNREVLSDIACKITQQSLVILCEVLLELNTMPSIDDFLSFSLAIDKLRLLSLGTLIGSFWHTTEKEEFKKQYYSEGHQKKLNDDSEILHLPEDLRKHYDLIRKKYLNTVLSLDK